MHITSGICTQIVAAVKVALMPLYEMIPVLVSDEKCSNKRILFTYTHVHVSHTWLELLQAWQSMLPLLVSSVSFHWFDYKHHMYLHERGREIEREELRKRGREGSEKGKVGRRLERINGKGGNKGRREE